MANVSHIKIDGTTYDITPASPVSVGNGQLTIQKNGVNVQTFTANQSSNVVANIAVSKTDVGLGNVPNVSTNNQTPTFTEATTRANINSGETLSVILGKVKKFFTDLKTVAFSGSYNDLSNKPTIPTNTNQLTNGAGYITSSGSCNYANSSGVAGSVAWGGVSNKPVWGLFQDRVTSTDITFPTNWTQAEILLRDNSTSKAAVFKVHKAILTSGNTVLTSGYYYTSADYCSFIIFINQNKIYGKSVTINGAVRANTDTTITILTSAAEV